MNMKLPGYNEIPDVGLYLEQVSKYLNSFLEDDLQLTGTMITNYVKLKIVPKAIKKAYSREQIALFFLVAITKSVLSMDQIRKVFALRNDTRRLYEDFAKGIKEEDCNDELIAMIAKTVLAKRKLDDNIASL